MTIHTHTTTVSKLGLGLILTGLIPFSMAAPRSQSMRDTPAPISVISGQDLTHHSTLELTTIRDIAAHVPHQPNGQPIYIRGTNVAIGAGDGIRSTGLLGGLRDLQSVEVLRGPQGSLFGADTQTGVVTVFTSAGHLDNTTYDPFKDHSSSYVSAGINYRNNFDLGAGKLSLSAGLAYTYYDDKFEYRDGDDSYLYDFYLQGRYTQEISPSAQLDINIDLNYGEHGTVGGGFTWAGALQSPVFSFRADAETTFRTDGNALSAPGLVHRSGIHFGGFREKQGDYVDSTRLSLSHE
ncbi:MAG: hypothetical protein KJO79_09470, partial [Verrucomicrobiae bacterium]|nr:hypothetical protein [Verrucomicrobiae bacterium]NNJ87398.1 hypothetical protein [Akkermansiaceae bacterium]